MPDRRALAKDLEDHGGDREAEEDGSGSKFLRTVTVAADFPVRTADSLRHAGLRLLEFVDRRGLERELAGLRRRLQCALVPGSHPVLDDTARQLARYFAGESLTFDLPLAPVGTDFQRRVWAELGRIPPGRTRSYAEMAALLGIPRAPRAIGRANGSNMLALVIPCHRVINADGSLCGYAGGLWRKQRLLEHERQVAAGTSGAPAVGS